MKRAKKKPIPQREGPVVIILPRPGYNPYSNETAPSVLPKLNRKVEKEEQGEFGLPRGVKMSAYTDWPK